MNKTCQRKFLENTPKIGEIYFMKFSGAGSAQNGWRPGLIIQNNQGNKYSPNIIAVPLTSVIKKFTQPTHVFIPQGEAGLIKDSMVLCENPESVPKESIRYFISVMPQKYMVRCAKALAMSMPTITYLSETQLLSIWGETSTLNAV